MKKIFIYVLLLFIVISVLSMLSINKKESSKVTPRKGENIILVNKNHGLSKDYVPNNLELVDKYTSKEIYLVKEAKDSYIKMVEDMKKIDLNIRLVSGYRDYTYQENLYNSYKKDDINADSYSAKPGYSEHQTGLALDIDNVYLNYNNFGGTDEYIWMINNSYKYGFILRYPRDKEEITGYVFEPWHYRYVGKNIAEYIFKNNLCLEEYLEIKKEDN